MIRDPREIEAFWHFLLFFFSPFELEITETSQKETEKSEDNITLLNKYLLPCIYLALTLGLQD